MRALEFDVIILGSGGAARSVGGGTRFGPSVVSKSAFLKCLIFWEADRDFGGGIWVPKTCDAGSRLRRSRGRDGLAYLTG